MSVGIGVDVVVDGTDMTSQELNDLDYLVDDLMAGLVADGGVDASIGESLAVDSLAAGTSAAKAVKAKKAAKAKKPKSAPLHPPYEEMVRDAIVSLNEKTGSSQYAIAKFIEEKEKNLPPNFRKLLLFHLKKLVSAGKIVQVKRSFKLPPVRSAAPKPAAAAPAKPGPKKAFILYFH